MNETRRCPACRAEMGDGPQCRRCRADLSLLVTLENQRRQCLMEASRLLAQGKAAEALGRADRADALRAGADSRRLLALGHLLRRDYALAWESYQIAGGASRWAKPS